MARGLRFSAGIRVMRPSGQLQSLNNRTRACLILRAGAIAVTGNLDQSLTCLLVGMTGYLFVAGVDDEWRVLMGPLKRLPVESAT